MKLWFKHLTKGYQVTLTTDYGIYSVAVDDDCRIVCGGSAVFVYLEHG